MKKQALCLSKKMTLFVCLFFFLFKVSAQTIKGKVVDAKTAEPLTGATVELEGNKTKKVVNVNLDGSYSFKNVSTGSYEVKVKFTGYKSIKEKKIQVNNTNDIIVLNIELEEESNQLEEVKVTAKGGKTDDASVRRLEKNAEVVLNILSQKAIELSPDVTVANALQRISGVTIERSSSGEGRYAIIRGMDQRYNNTLVNGIKIPSPDDKFRYVPMDLFPSDLLERLEVIKALTPNMEGDAIGGTMNLVMKSAPNKKLFNIHAAMGYNTLFSDRPFATFNQKVINKQDPATINGANYIATDADFPRANLNLKNLSNPINAQLGFTLGNRFLNKKLGVVVGVSFQNMYRGSDNLFFRQNAQPSIAPVDNYPAFDDAFVRQYSTQQRRLGINNKIDYVINNRNKISLSNLYMHMDEFQARYTIDTVLAIQRTGPGSGNVYIFNRTRWQIQSIYNSTLQGEHQLSSKLNFKWSAVYSIAKQNVPDQAEFEHDHEVKTNLTTGVATETPYLLKSMNRIWRNNSDQDKSIYANFTYTPSIGKTKIELSVGGMFRHKDRSNYFNSYKLSPKNSNTQVYTNIYDAKYDFNTADAGKGDQVNQNTYTSIEEISAGYAQFKFNATEKLQVLGGARIEGTNQNYTTVMPATFDGRYGKIWYTDVLPSLHLKYLINKKQNIRASYFKGLTRPGFFEITPYFIQNEYFIEQGNPYLKHTTADNFDIRYELFPNGADQLLVGVFYKNIQNPIEIGIVKIGTGTQVLTPQNYGNATNYGFELVYTKFFGKVGINANYTYTNSSITTNKRYYYRNTSSGSIDTKDSAQTRPMQGQANHIGNIALLFKDSKLGLDAQLALVYTGERISQVSPYFNLDYWQTPYTQLDFSIEKKIVKHVSLYGKINNLTSSTTKFILKQPNLIDGTNNALPEQDSKSSIFVQRDIYKINFLFGVRFKL
jgi:outer membrane receptor protein involved in Fe transport